jgi:hypothetical protein
VKPSPGRANIEQVRASAVRRWVVVVLGSLALTIGQGVSARAADSRGPPAGIQQPNFTDLQHLQVTVDGRTVALGRSGLTFRRRSVTLFDDPSTPGHDGVPSATRDFLACKVDRWSMGNQIFTVDAIAVGNAVHAPSLVARGVEGLDWGVRQHLGRDGVYTLTRSCDGRTVADFGGTHHTTQWLSALGEAVYQLRASPYAGDFTARIRVYVAEMQAIARRLVQRDNWRVWTQRWLRDDQGHLFTHKTYMMAAALGLTASVTDVGAEATRWATTAERIARKGMSAQHADGVNPERGGYDVAYQTYGAWLAELYYTTLGPGHFKDALADRIDHALAWESSRVDDRTGQVRIAGSTRICRPIDDDLPFEAADTVRAFLTWSVLHARPELAARAVLVDHGAKTTRNPCP